MSNDVGVVPDIAHGSDSAECRIRTDGGSSDGRDREEVDRLLGLLATHRRRHALYYLRELEVATVDEVARLVAEKPSSTAESTDIDARIEETKLALKHVDLPKLTARDIVEYDRRSGMVRYRQPSARLTTLLDSCAELEETPFTTD
ncbi:DUF7344 domain-containing protein [Natronorubrum texcoconense]|uniref:DUF7344 domain-containing protein n=1 Tax=Natronorubrum texcoconense TaxID=1095776 RepID=A0A1G8TBN3_9EURY|nr:hypothetical protein [Natronorubrum texcoconense]SDJ38100.1 hypothetical protein SAMN04515672_0374 [Natronorubrum texcoconense]